MSFGIISVVVFIFEVVFAHVNFSLSRNSSGCSEKIDCLLCLSQVDNKQYDQRIQLIFGTSQYTLRHIYGVKIVKCAFEIFVWGDFMRIILLFWRFF